MSSEFMDWFFRQAQTEKGGKGSGNFNHAGRVGKVGGSAPASATTPKAGTDFGDEELSFAKKLLTQPDGFSERPDLPSPKQGYMVSLPRERGLEFVAGYSFLKNRPEYLAAFIKKNMDLVTGSDNLYFGGWAEDGKFFLDVSENIIGRKEALLAGKDREQYGIFDIVKGETITMDKYDAELEIIAKEEGKNV